MEWLILLGVLATIYKGLNKKSKQKQQQAALEAAERLEAQGSDEGAPVGAAARERPVRRMESRPMRRVEDRAVQRVERRPARPAADRPAARSASEARPRTVFARAAEELRRAEREAESALAAGAGLAQAADPARVLGRLRLEELVPGLSTASEPEDASPAEARPARPASEARSSLPSTRSSLPSHRTAGERLGGGASARGAALPEYRAEPRRDAARRDRVPARGAALPEYRAPDAPSGGRGVERRPPAPPSGARAPAPARAHAIHRRTEGYGTAPSSRAPAEWGVKDRGRHAGGDVRALLASGGRRSLRNAVILREVFGAPQAMRRSTELSIPPSR